MAEIYLFIIFIFLEEQVQKKSMYVNNIKY